MQTIFRSMILLIFCLCVSCRPQIQPDKIDEAQEVNPIQAFLADQTVLSQGDCTELTWTVSAGYAIEMDGESLPEHGQMQICPTSTTIYTLKAIRNEGSFEQQVEIIVEGSEVPVITGSQSIEPGTPAYLNGSWQRLGGPPGGLGYDIRMNPDNPDIMYVTDAKAGIHRSGNGGMNWIPVNQGVIPFSGQTYTVFCVTIDPHNADRIWIGTQFTGQIYLSTDGGDTWQEKDAGIAYEGYSVRGITIDPLNPDIIYAGVEVSSASWNKEPIVKRFDLPKGEVYKSINGGASWQRIWVGDNLARYIWVDPRNTNRIYVSTGIFDRDAANSDVPNGDWGGVGILRSDDAGATWTVLDSKNGLGGLYIPSLFMHPENPDMLLAAVTNSSDAAGAYLTRDGGDHWEMILAMPEGYGAEAVEISTRNPDIWYAASEDHIWRSDDAGETWQHFRLEVSNREAGIPIDLQVDPRDPMRIFVNNYGGGNFLSTNGAETWQEASSGYTGYGAFEMGVSPINPFLVFTNFYYSMDAGHSWIGKNTPGFSSIRFFIQPDSGEEYVIAGAGDRIWTSPTSEINWEYIQLADIPTELQEQRPMVLTGLAVAPSDNHIMYAGFANNMCASRDWNNCYEPTPGLYRSTDAGKSWQPISESTFKQTSILAIAIHPTDSQQVYVATSQGLFQSQDGGEHWRQLESLDIVTRSVPVFDVGLIPENLPASMVFDIQIDPFEPSILYAASLPGGVFKSKDSGESWTQMAAGMDPNEPVTAIVPDPTHPGLIYASSEFSGALVSTDAGEHWQIIADGLSMTRMTAIALSADGSVLYGATNGGGVFVLGAPMP
ncbi:MAG: hypothetical protein JEZ00_16835 [Anaerolineaceae bacterium]|nr:hypothetical protein [Anaerolineaceae bacterium]